MGRTVVVLGGTGYLGRHIGTVFTTAGDTVVDVARGGAVRLDLTCAGATELACLLGDLKADVVVNAAGAVWATTEDAMAATNDVMPGRLAAAVAALPRRPRLVQLGTVHEYGPGVRPRATSETAVPAPVTPYGRTKLAGTRHVLDAVARHGLDAVVLRVANVSGPGAPTGSLLGAVAARLAAGGDPVELRLAPLQAYRDYVDARDVAEAVRCAADGPHAAGHVINVGRGEAVSVRGLVRRLIALAGVPVRIVAHGTEDDAPARRDVEWQCLDVSRAARVLGWRARRSLDTSLRDQLAAV